MKITFASVSRVCLRIVPEGCADVNMLRLRGIADAGDPVRSEDIARVNDSSRSSEESGGSVVVVVADGAGTMATCRRRSRSSAPPVVVRATAAAPPSHFI